MRQSWKHPSMLKIENMKIKQIQRQDMILHAFSNKPKHNDIWSCKDKVHLIL